MTKHSEKKLQTSILFFDCFLQCFFFVCLFVYSECSLVNSCVAGFFGPTEWLLGSQFSD